MDIGSLFLILAILVGVSAFLARPLLESGDGSADGSQALSSLLAERENVLSLLYDTEMDHMMGKLLAEDYKAQRAEQMARGAVVLKQIDELAGSQPSPSELSALAEREQIRRDPEGWLETEIARMRGVERGAAEYCHECGQGLVQGDRFCSRCGASIESEDSST